MENRKNELISFWRKLGKLIESGVPLLHTLATISKETRDEEFKKVVENIKTYIEAGSSMAEAIAKSPEWFSASVQDVIRAGEIQGTLDKAVAKVVEGLTDGTFEIKEKPQVQSLEGLDDKDAEHVIKTIGKILVKSVEDRASDIHFEALADRFRVRYRIDGVLREAESLPKETHEAVLNRIKIMANMNLAEKRLPQDGRILVNVKGQDLDIRVSIAPYITGESAAMRILTRQNVVFKLDKIGFTKANYERVKNWCKKNSRLIVITGPAGSGKTTTLYSLLQEMNDPKLKIITVEDPVEYQLDGINQMAVNPVIGITFATALYSQLRQAPNIMAVGEIRDLDTANLLFRAILTGHLVITTLHTNDAPAAISRLLDIGVAPFMINTADVCVISQQLVRIICRDCIEEYKPKEWATDLMREYKDMKFFKGKGCEKCHNTGYRGRTAVHELLELDDKMKRLIANNAGSEELRKQAIESGMITMRQDGIEKAKQGITTIEEVMRVCYG